MSKKILTTPIKAEDLADIKIGDVIYLKRTHRHLPRRAAQTHRAGGSRAAARYQGRRDPACGADHQKNGR